MWTTTDVVAVAVPLNAGVVFFEGVGGSPKVTVGEVVSTTNVTAELLPAALPRELGCSAIAVY
jgi:hypothetical protein